MEIAKLEKEKTHIVQHKLAYVSSELKDLKLQISSAYANFTNEIDAMDRYIHRWHKIVFESKLEVIANLLETMLNVYQETFGTLTKAVQAARIGHLHPSLISTIKLQKIIRQKTDLHLNYDFPIPIEHARADKLGNIAKVRLGYRNGKFLAGITIPLLNKDASEIYKLH